MDGLRFEWIYNRRRKWLRNEHSSGDQSTFCINWFLIMLQYVVIDQIHFNTS